MYSFSKCNSIEKLNRKNSIIPQFFQYGAEFLAVTYLCIFRLDKDYVRTYHTTTIINAKMTRISSKWKISVKLQQKYHFSLC